jgi:ATP adenylyltransferase/5',5'''-P-1,P-4-tetraphosphate phosphorylase II
MNHLTSHVQIEFRVCPAFARKPNTFKAALDTTFDKSRKWGPGSDLFCPDERLKLAKLNGTHDLALNLFCVNRPQLLILTLDSYKRQYDPLDCDDFAAALQVLTALDDMYVIFNGGEAAGCTRIHRHMQGLLGPPRAFELLVGGAQEQSRIPFQYFSHHFVRGFTNSSASDLLEIYLKLLDEAKEAMRLLQPDEACAHNVVLWKDWIIVIPRRSAVVGSHASANAAGMLGSVWIADQSPVDEWLELGCRNVLEQLGLPR